MSETKINWINAYEEGVERARDEKKPLFLDFFKDGWGGCAKLGTVTYPNLMVATLLNENFVPVQVDIEAVSKLANEFQAIWTPNLNVLNHNQKRVYRVEGWLPPSEFIAMLGTARGHYYLRGKKYAEAEPLFKDVFDQHPRSHFAPEALYYRGVSRYLNSHEVDELKEDWIMLQRFYPQSTWSMRANIL